MTQILSTKEMDAAIEKARVAWNAEAGDDYRHQWGRLDSSKKMELSGREVESAVLEKLRAIFEIK